MFADVFKSAEPKPDVLSNVNALGERAEVHCSKP